MPDISERDVVIVGGGPVGMGLAIELGQRGASVAVVERYASPQPIPKGQNLTQRSMEHFRAWGAEAALRAARTVPPGYAIGGMTSYGTLLSGYHYDWLQRELVRPYYYTDNERLPQYATEAVLRARAAQIETIEVHYGWSGEALRQDGDGVELLMRQHGGTAETTLRGRYLVGCDGSHSAIREMAGITQTKSDHDRLMVLLVFRSTALHKLLERYPGKQFYCVLHPELQGYWMFFGRVDLGSTWFFHAPVPPGTTADNFDFAAYLHRAVGETFDVEFEHVGFWDLRIALADSYRAARVLIAGDAAHSHPPYGGYGVNTGLEDARNLGWKLAAVLEGWGGEALLDSYDAERRPVFASTAKDFIERFITEDRHFLNKWNPEADEAAFARAWTMRNSGAAEVTAFEPNYDGSPIIFGTEGAIPGARGQHVFEARAGHHFAPTELSSGRTSFEELGTGFTLFDLGDETGAADAFRAAGDVAGIPLKVVEDRDSPARSTYAARLVLVRPDHFVAWAGDVVEPSADRILSVAAGR